MREEPRIGLAGWATLVSRFGRKLGMASLADETFKSSPCPAGPRTGELPVSSEDTRYSARRAKTGAAKSVPGKIHGSPAHGLAVPAARYKRANSGLRKAS